jgi:hypothetical protein
MGCRWESKWRACGVEHCVYWTVWPAERVTGSGRTSHAVWQRPRLPLKGDLFDDVGT